MVMIVLFSTHYLNMIKMRADPDSIKNSGIMNLIVHPDNISGCIMVYGLCFEDQPCLLPGPHARNDIILVLYYQAINLVLGKYPQYSK
jgi:hypothetical protein